MRGVLQIYRPPQIEPRGSVQKVASIWEFGKPIYNLLFYISFLSSSTDILSAELSGVMSITLSIRACTSASASTKPASTFMFTSLGKNFDKLASTCDALPFNISSASSISSGCPRSSRISILFLM